VGSQANTAKPTSERVRLRRRRERGSHDRQTIDAILDEGLIAHLAIVMADGQPLAIPTLHARDGDVVYCHGSSAGRTMHTTAGGGPACLTVSLIDGLVLARSAMHHSANYRSAIILGEAREVSEPEEKRAAFRTIVERIVPGRWQEIRPPTDNEMRATTVVALAIDEAAAKGRSGPPVDDEEDYELDAWAGVIPLSLGVGTPQPDPLLRAGIELPEYVRAYRRTGTP
jgi:nitroimidazol reductase NimA-like FMN-containing flavoprotein (pyridoxamine 5'-phosphate oxidase superfamily)